MLNTIRLWVRTRYRVIVNSIAFYPAFIALLFALLSVFLIWFDFTPTGRDIRSGLGWMGLKDASAARAIIATIAGGTITLTVFSFSMVMIVLNQAASQLSNRILDQLIGNRFQQMVLGTYIGSIIYALLLLSAVRENGDEASLPVISTYLLILIAIVDIFLFIYFLHFITQAVKYEVIISRIAAETQRSLEKTCGSDQEVVEEPRAELPFVVSCTTSGIQQDMDDAALLSYCVRHDCAIAFADLPGTFLLKGAPLVRTDRPLSEEEQDALRDLLPLSRTGSVASNYAFGLRQLTEVALKALSPGVNDPGTAILAIRSLFELFSYRLEHFPVPVLRDENDRERVFKRVWTFDLIFSATVRAIWDVGHGDRSIRHELEVLLPQLRTPSDAVAAMKDRVHKAIEKQA